MQTTKRGDTGTENLALGQQILIVEDEVIFAKAVHKHLIRAGYKCNIAFNLASAEQALKDKTPDLILLDMRLPDGSGLNLINVLKSKKGNYSDIPVLVMSAYGEIEDAVSAMKAGASDYLKKPIDMQELLLTIDKALARNKLETKLAYSNKREYNAATFVELIGECPGIIAIKQQIEQINRLIDTAVSVPPNILILGETGTGKDVIARLMHSGSVMHNKPFVQVDCASLPREIIEAELFGHEKGAFTNAHVARTGLIEAAEDGTLFMDEIGELPLDLQSKLLAVLERRLIRRVGSNKELSIHAWFITATNRQLRELVERGEFRSDLYYRLNVLSIDIPPLRQRGADIILLAEHFARETAKRYNFGAINFSDSALQAITEYPWPGNVREIKHLVERAVLLNTDGTISPDLLGLGNWHLDNHSRSAVPHDTDISSQSQTLASAELKLIQQALERANGNVSMASRELGITRMALRYRMKKHQLSG